MYESQLFSSGLSSGLLVGFIFGSVLVAILLSLGSAGKTKRYRKDLTNLYVAGRIRQIAEKDNINISDEYEVFKKYLKKNKMEDWDLDVSIEEELKDKIGEEKKEVKVKEK